MECVNVRSSITMQQLKLEYQSCVETEQSAIQSFANDRIKCLLAKLSSMSPKEKRASERLLMQATLQQCDEILKPSSVDKSIVFRSLEAQVLLRFQFWANLGDKFVQYYKKQKLSRKKNRRKHHGRKEQTSSNQFVLNDICDLLSMLAMKLPQSLPFAAFLNNTLDRRRYYSDGTSNLPKDLFQKIYRRFEIPDPETTTETEEFVDFAAIKSPTNARMKRRDSMASIGSASSSKENMNVPDSKPLATKGSGASLQQQPRLKKKAAALNLVAPTKRRNSLFGGSSQPSHFVGSHFNTRLTNIDALFREVPDVKNKQSVGLSTKPTKRSAMQPAKGKSSSLGVGSKRKSQCFQVPHQASSKKSKAGQSSTRGRRGEAPIQPTKPSLSARDLHRQVVVEARNALRRQR